MKPSNLKWIILGCLTVYLLLLMAHPLPIENSDFGLNIKLNGLAFSEIQYQPCSAYSADSPTLLEKFSFTLDQWTGLTGYHLLSMLLVVLAFSIVFFLALQNAKNLLVVGLVSLFCIPLIAMRHQELDQSFRLIIIGLLAYWGMTQFVPEQRKGNTKRYLILAFLLVCLLLTIPDLFDVLYSRLFHDTGFNFAKTNTLQGTAISLLGWVIVVCFGVGFYLIRAARKSRLYWGWLVLTVFGFLVSYFSLSVNILALIAIPVLSYQLSSWRAGHPKAEQLIGYRSPLLALFIVIPLIWLTGLWNPFNTSLGIGAGSAKLPAQFFLDNKLEGRIFNNQLSASYLAYYLTPSEQLYTACEFQDYAQPFFQNETGWKKEADHYQFNTLFFRLNGESTEGLTFLGRRLAEREQWALVYFEEGEWAILLRRNEKNSRIIDKFEQL